MIRYQTDTVGYKYGGHGFESRSDLTFFLSNITFLTPRWPEKTMKQPDSAKSDFLIGKLTSDSV